MSRTIPSALLVAALSAAAVPASAHMGLEPNTAAAGATIALGFRVTHGCGTSPTTAIKVRVPAGVTNVLPQPKAGWTLTVVRAPGAAGAAPAADQPATAPVTEVHWTGGALPAEFFDVFTIRARLPAAPNTTVYFPVVQECQTGVHRWIDVPQAGQPEPAEPTPGLRLTP